MHNNCNDIIINNCNSRRQELLFAFRSIVVVGGAKIYSIYVSVFAFTRSPPLSLHHTQLPAACLFNVSPLTISSSSSVVVVKLVCCCFCFQPMKRENHQEYCSCWFSYGKTITCIPTAGWPKLTPCLEFGYLVGQLVHHQLIWRQYCLFKFCHIPSTCFNFHLLHSHSPTTVIIKHIKLP